jgi:hypothetical protein
MILFARGLMNLETGAPPSKAARGSSRSDPTKVHKVGVPEGEGGRHFLLVSTDTLRQV